MTDEGWSDEVCAELSGLDVSVIKSLLADEIIVTPEIAKGLAKLSNFGEKSWLNSESIYQENIDLYEGRKNLPTSQEEKESHQLQRNQAYATT